ncbi:MAG: aminotransferase class I/II-fold pyridoxal phosphate-dependent enzyme [Pseudomonadota bacterium]|nr:aminotransferase class I/II-fold pyridoxal phosphate-dependent enzyme [Pseudomonadota bacterium]
MPHLSQRISTIAPAGRTGWEVHFEAERRRAAGEEVIFCSIGDHDFDTPAETVEACVEAVRAGHHHYTGLAGYGPLREAIARATTHSTGVATRADNIITTVGGQGALFAAIQATLDPGEHAIVIGPYYATYPGCFRLSGNPYTVVDARPEDDFQPRRDALEAALTPGTRIVLMNSPNNPTGAVYSRETLEAIASFCRDNDLWLISDEVYWTHTGKRAHVSPLSLEGMEPRTLVVNSVSKSHAMTGWRVGWLRAPAQAVARLTAFSLVVTYGLSDFVSRAAAEALDNEWGLAEIALTYERRRELMLAALRGLEGVTIHGSQGGMYVMLDVRAIEPDGERFAFDLLRTENVAVMPGESFGEAAAGHVRISLCQPDEVLEEAARRLARFVRASAAASSPRAAGALS